jgi:SulP family sulfate permease
LFGGIPATGAIARTATNVKNGARTPIAGIVHAMILLAILLFAGQWASLIPLATLAGILAVVAYDMSEWRLFLRLLRGPRSDVLVLAVTFLLTVLVDLSTAIQVGVVLAALLFMRRMADVTEVRAVTDLLAYEEEREEDRWNGEVPRGVEVFEINGSFCFGATQQFTENLTRTRAHVRTVILRMRHVLAIDATGLHALEQVAGRLERRGTELLLSGVQPKVEAAIGRSGFQERQKGIRLFPLFSQAVEYAREREAGTEPPGPAGTGERREI